MRNFKIFLIFLIQSLVFCSYEFEFLNMPFGAKASGCGGNFVAVYNFAESLFYNPASCSLSSNFEFSLAHRIHLLDISVNQISFLFPFGKFSFGFFGEMLTSSEIKLIRDYENLGTFRYTSSLYGGTFGFNIFKNFCFGISSKYVNEEVHKYNKSVFLYDFGFLVKTKKDIFSLGCALNNYDPFEKCNVYTSYNIGLRFTLNLPSQQTKFNFLFSTKIDYKTNNPVYIFSLEHWGQDLLGLRCGYVYDKNKIESGVYNDFLSFLTAGLSLKIGSFNIDYAYIPNSILGTTHNLGLSFSFKKKSKIKEVELPLELKVEPQNFSPNEDGYLDNIFFQHNISTFNNLIMANYLIKDENDKVIEVIKTTSTKSIFDTFYVYNAKIPKGEILKDGIYSVELVLKDKLEDKILVYRSEKKYFVVDTTPPKIYISKSTDVFFTGDNNFIKFNVNIEDLLSDIENIEFKILTIENKEVFSYETLDFEKAKTIKNLELIWDGKDELYRKFVPTGKYKILCKVKDAAGNVNKYEDIFEVISTVEEKPKIIERLIYIPKAKVLKEDRKIVVRYFIDELFIKGTFKINPEFFESLKILAELLETEFKDRKITIEGHTDSVGDAEENKAKANSYAWSVYSYLVKDLNLDITQIEVKSWGEEKPIASNKTRTGRAENRRVEIIIH